MRKALFLSVTISLLLLSFKDKRFKVNPAVLGKYYASDTSPKPSWILKANLSDDNKVEFYQSDDIEPTFVAVMKDSTHFKTQHDFSHTANQVTKMWGAKGNFLPNNQMELAVHISDVTTGMKFTFSIDEDQKIIYTKR